jgi:hypothetical protein
MKQKAIGLSLKCRKTHELSFILPEVDSDYFIESATEALETDWEDIQIHYQTVLVEITEIEDYEVKND